MTRRQRKEVGAQGALNPTRVDQEGHRVYTSLSKLDFEVKEYTYGEWNDTESQQRIANDFQTAGQSKRSEGHVNTLFQSAPARMSGPKQRLPPKLQKKLNKYLKKQKEQEKQKKRAAKAALTVFEARDSDDEHDFTLADTSKASKSKTSSKRKREAESNETAPLRKKKKRPTKVKSESSSDSEGHTDSEDGPKKRSAPRPSKKYQPLPSRSGRQTYVVPDGAPLDVGLDTSDFCLLK